MISTQKLFIRGIFENFADIDNAKQKTMPEYKEDSLMADTLSSESDAELQIRKNIYLFH
jgi:hypothetical protein